MRWFWLFIASLTLLTAVLYTTRVRAERAQQAAQQAQAEQDAPNTAKRRSRDRASRSDRQSPPDRQTETIRDPEPQPEPQPDPQPDPKPEASAQPEAQPERQSGSQPDSQPETPTPAQPPAQPEKPVRDEPLETAADTSPTPAFDPSALVNAFKQAESQRTIEPDPDPEPDGSDRVVDDGQSQPIAQTARSDAETHTGTQPEAQSDEQTPAQPEADAFGQALAQAARENSGTQPDPGQPEEPAAAEDDAPRSYELRPDGSFRVIEQDVWVQGAGTAAKPYVLSWDVLKTVEKSYDPRNGKKTIPDWLDHLDGKVVQIEGNTLVPVVATTTRELLVMQNPWDGCCIGVPPTPYDAIEVVLNHDVDFGNSAVGFGSVLGTFYLDPYIVDGWVLGLYIVEDAKYRSGEGVEFPQF